MKKPSSELTLERIDNNGNYESNNCIWDTPYVQSHNRRNTKLSLEQVDKIKELYEKYNQTEISRIYKVSATYVCSIIHGRRGKTFKYEGKDLF